MKTPLTVSLLALALSAIALVALLTDSAAPGLREEKASAPVVAGPDAELLAEVRALRDRLALLEALPAPTPPPERAPVAEDFVTEEDFAAFRDEVRKALEGASLATSIQAPEFKDRLADTLEEIRQDEAVEKTDASYQKRVDRLADRMVYLDDKLGLTRQQSNAMQTELLAKYERDADMMRRFNQGEDVEVVGEVKMANHRIHQEALSTILTPEQLETYGTLRWGDGGK